MEGGSLAALLAESRTAKSQLPDLVVLAYAQQV
jgi:hypothetical protein